MVFERPKKPRQGQSSNPFQRPTRRDGSGRGPRDRTTGGRGNGGNRGGNGDEPSPWLVDPDFEPASSASFVEYLRWMRSPDSDYKDPTKVQILQLAEENANYRDRLITLTNRTQRIAGNGNTFQVQCPWRIRVGGHRGPESILLPAFDALGMPYIPSSTLRGIARAQAIRECMERDNLSWKLAEEAISRQYFGYLDSKQSAERSGKVIFLDAYPLPQQSGDGGGLAVDMANNIWKWDAAGRDLLYEPNPNPFFSLAEATFLIGIRPTLAANSVILDKVKGYLIRGLQTGIGSQINTGYGSLVQTGKPVDMGFFSVDFTLEGQLIHGRKKFKNVNSPFQRDRDGTLRTDRKGNLKTEDLSDPEVRPVAFKSMLRYWFRAFVLGVLPSREVQRLEGELFGAINPRQARGKVVVRIVDGRIVQREARPTRQGQDDPCGEQSGRLILAYSSEALTGQKRDLEVLFKNLTWMMFHLGGIGQGARRPCYSRKTRNRAPWWRGSTLIPDTQDSFWTLPRDVREFRDLFRRRLQAFYDALGRLAGSTISPRHIREAEAVRRDRWTEAVDKHCRMIVCTGDAQFGKPYALAVLHGQDFKHGQDYDGNLCGQVRGKNVKPSPVWIADIDEYQVVTVFGATQNPRERYVNELQRQTDPNNYAQIWPLK